MILITRCYDALLVRLFCVYNVRVFILIAFLICVYIDAVAAAFEDM
jgi:hypothetical protein